MSTLLEFAKNELNNILEQCQEDTEALKLQKQINKDILDIINLFSKQGHSGGSASYVISVLNRLLHYKPLTPLTGNDDEWEDITKYGVDDTCYQNKRYPAVFKDKDNRAYNVEGKAFSDDNGHTWYTNGDSRVYIEFPYNVPESPEQIIVDNKELRLTILQELQNIINCITNKEILNLNEDVKLSDILTIDEFFQLKEHLLNNKISLNSVSIHHIDSVALDYNTYIWSLINMCINNIN